MIRRRAIVPLLAATAGLVGGRKPVMAQSGGWTPLFNGRDFEGWDRIGNANWRVEESALVADRGSGFLVTQRDYRDFQLRAEFFVDSHTNSGIYIRCTNPAMVSTASSYEVNIWDERPEQRYGTGAIVDLAAVDPMPKAGGRWNLFEITAAGDTFTVILNGQKTADSVRDSRFSTGRIALQHAPGVPGAGGAVNDTGVVRFRKVEIQAS
ncbi:DUF1080 domain-containing protein [Roseomonas sp. SSH11]|uniref:DUF1080 domain-containing protein n=1 Tax=Pararoseomonas baculiformis TaxID=2820812 RepID=A0ABS4AKJ3_9PROT|nr:DUF1080 domain-containing protein [Pararoseomonas baculiformis]MBP0447401.1 DUF1080 domain-containing protein [Pararoseomonas baculiformis]